MSGSDSHLVVLAGYSCCCCGEIRAYGTQLPDQRLSDYGTYRPLINCQHCGRLTRHECVGFKEFDYTREQSWASGNLSIIKRICPIETKRQARHKAVSAGGSVQ